MGILSGLHRLFEGEEQRHLFSCTSLGKEVATLQVWGRRIGDPRVGNREHAGFDIPVSPASLMKNKSPGLFPSFGGLSFHFVPNDQVIRM